MSMKAWGVGLVCVTCWLVASEILRADEASGLITSSSFGAFQMDEKGTVRQFNLSRANSVYEPSTWFPNVGDKVKVTFFIKSGKKTVLEVQKVELVKIGPNNTPPITSPLTVEIVEIGRSGWMAKIASGQIVKFESTRKTLIQPAGLVLMPGQKAKIEFHAEKPAFAFGLRFVADKLEKVDK